MLAGALVGIGLVVAAALPATGRFGIESIAASRAQLGARGSYLGLALLYLSVLGWNCLLMIFLGRAAPRSSSPSAWSARARATPS